MPTYELTYEIYEHYLHIHVNGTLDSRDISSQYWMEISRLCHDHSKRIVFVEENFENQPHFFDVYKTIRDLSKEFTGITVIFVDENKGHWIANKFAETVATNLGLKCHIFSTVSDAKHKLEELIQ